MDDDPGLSDQYRMASPWPLFVALGIPIAELGILFGVFALAVGGLLLFCGSVAGLLREAGYVESAWRALAACGAILLPISAAFVFTDVSLVTRGYAVGVAAGLLLFGAAVGELIGTGESVPA